MIVPPPVLAEHDRFVVLRDDLILGGSKARTIPRLMAESGAPEWVFAGPSSGYAQVALGVGVQQTGVRATFVCPARKDRTPLTRLAARLGVTIREIPAGRLTVLEARAREHAAATGALQPKLGLDVPGALQALQAVAAALPLYPEEVWVAAGSGLLARALAAAWPRARICAVQVGAHSTLPDCARRFEAPEPFAEPAVFLPPYPSVASYDAKVWRFAARYGRPGALIWNVAGPCPQRGQVDACLAAGTLALPAARPGS